VSQFHQASKDEIRPEKILQGIYGNFCFSPISMKTTTMEAKKILQADVPDILFEGRNKRGLQKTRAYTHFLPSFIRLYQARIQFAKPVLFED
jgi:hypothetical protein